MHAEPAVGEEDEMLLQLQSAQWPRRTMRLLGSLAALLASSLARAADSSFVDKVADVMAVIVLIIVPVIVIVVFWLVHVMPEKIAHKRHHPQTAAITTLCLLSLVFGGLLWPLAWLWAYTKPIGYRMAYGTDKHEDYYEEMAQKHSQGELVREEIVHLREDLDAIEARGALPPKLKALKEALDSLRADEVARAQPEQKGAV
jgi:CBS domain containing-hemolysin-like protein